MGPWESKRTLGGGKEGNPRALWEGDGTIWIYSEAIPNGKLSRSQSDGNKFRSQSEWKGRSKWMTLPNRKLFHVFTQAVVKSK